MKLDTIAAKYRLGLLAPAELPQIGIEALEAGFDTPALRQLAGEDGNDFDGVKQLFEKALMEIGNDLPPQDEAALLVARSIAEEVIGGQLDPYEGARRIWSRVYVKNPNLKELRVFVGLASELEDDPQNKAEYLRDIIKQCREIVAGSDQSPLACNPPRPSPCDASNPPPGG